MLTTFAKKGRLVPLGIILVIVFFAGCKPSTPKFKNRLSEASSPYLREHADNPVDWHEWGDEALKKAAAENKPLLISIGYAACHWCHQMEEQSFMDTAVARLMNENFICIKVDREERPDIDNVYIHACQLLNKGQAGWPLNAIALPDGKPFFVGTYYTKENWMALLTQVADSYKNKYNKVVLQANALTFGIIDADSALIAPANPGKFTKEFYHAQFQSLYAKIDTVHGGIRGRQKFPLPSIWNMVLQYYFLTKDPTALNALNNSLTKMAFGGIYDQVGGGFARYATDSLWRRPHFEKMLCDNAQLARVYTQAFQVTGNVFFKQVAQETIAFVERDLAAGNGGFYASVNADTKAGEGAYYKWREEDFSRVLSPAHQRILKDYFNVSQTGNDGNGENLLFSNMDPAAFATAGNLPVNEFQDLLQQSKQKLLIEREKRPKPSVDAKILASWNALMVSAYLDAHTAFGEEAYFKKAMADLEFVKQHLLSSDGHLWRSYVNGHPAIDGFLEDYALVAKAMLRMYQVSFDKHWLVLAERICAYAIRHFFDEKTRYFFFHTKDGSKLPVRKIELHNNVMPASNAVMGEVLYALGTLLDNEVYTNMANTMVENIQGSSYDLSFTAPDWVSLAGLQAFGRHEVAIIGQEALAMNRAMQRSYLPGCTFLGGSEENLPLLKHKLPAQGTLIFVCTNRTCLKPSVSVADALAQVRK